MTRKRITIAAMLTLVAAGAAVAAESLVRDGSAEPQRRRRGGFGFGRSVGSPGDLPIINEAYDGRFMFNRVRFEEGFVSRGPYTFGLDLGWNHDHPRAEQNLGLMLSELTTLPIMTEGGVVYSFAEPEVFDYPFAYISEPGYWSITDDELRNLRDFLQKGGFLMVDDMENDDTDSIYAIFQEIMPGAKFEILDTTHPVFNCFFQITPEDILNQYYRSRYGNPVIFGVFEDNDPGGRLLAVINHNQDIGESWEFSNVGYVPVEQANNSYKIGINYVLCSMVQ